MVDPADILVFENTDAGIAAARSAGMQVIAIRTTDDKGISTYDDADYAIDNFADLTLNELEFITNDHESE
jgi:beta-phosphoglucomutase-like phosphatase (HAD superfamily)